MRTLVIGYGNPVRNDDGIGPLVADEIERRRLPGVEVWIVQQLQIELAASLSDYEQIIFVDASESGPEMSFQSVDLSKRDGISSSHYTGPAAVGNLAQQIYGKSPALFLCSVRGENFDFGNTISNECLPRIQSAVSMITDFVRKEACHARS